ncbi:MAG: hypothetical protein ACRC6I_18080 [Paracoccaceae bacterium]
MTRRAVVRQIDIKRAIAAAVKSCAGGVRVVIEIEPKNGVIRISPEKSVSVADGRDIVL